MPFTMTQAEVGLFPEVCFMDLRAWNHGRHPTWPYGETFSPDSSVVGLAFIDSVLDVVWTEAEYCDYLQVFQACHFLGGGTGPCMGTLLISNIGEDRLMLTLCLPSPTVSDTVVEPDNASRGCMVLDNEHSMTSASELSSSLPLDFGDLNSFIFAIMHGVTCRLRFPGQLNSELQNLAVNVIPYSRLHFFMVGFPELTQKTWYAKDTTRAADPRNGRLLRLGPYSEEIKMTTKG